MDEKVLIYESTLTEIADAIREKRETEEEIRVTDMAEEILAIQVGVDTSDGTAAAEDVLVDKVAYVNEQRVVGTMVNNGAVDVELSAGESYSVPVGYHDGTGKVSTQTLASQTDGDATAAMIQEGKTAWVNGTKVTGTLAPSADDIKTGVTIAGVAGTFTSDANATSGDMLPGRTAYVNGVKVTGGMGHHGAVSATINAGESYTISAGFHNGSGKVTAKDLASQTSATATAADIASGKTAWVNGVLLTGSNPVSVKKARLIQPNSQNTTLVIGNATNFFVDDGSVSEYSLKMVDVAVSDFSINDIIYIPIAKTVWYVTQFNVNNTANRIKVVACTADLTNSTITVGQYNDVYIIRTNA